MEGDTPGAQWLRAWHGTPHDFGPEPRFQWDKIGSGEGAQAYGYGHYSAENREIAEWYRDSLTKRSGNQRQLTFNGREIFNDLFKLQDIHNTEVYHRDRANHLHRKIKESKASGSPLFISSDHREISGKPYMVAGEQLAYHEDLANEIAGELDSMVGEWESLHGIKLPGRDKATGHHIHLGMLKQIATEMVRDGATADEAIQFYRDGIGWLQPDENTSDEEWQKQIDEENRQLIELEPFIKAWELKDTPQNEGNLYELELRLHPDNLLHWERSVDEHHYSGSTGILKAVEEAGVSVHPGDSASSAYHKIAEGLMAKDKISRGEAYEAASKLLFSHGVHGIKYLDASSRHISVPVHEVTLDGHTMDGMEELAQQGVKDHPLAEDAAGWLLLDKIDTIQRNKTFNKPEDLIKYIEDRWNGPPQAVQWFKANKHRLGLKLQQDLRKFNYVVFDDNLVRVMRKLNRRGEVVEGYSDRPFPGAVVLKEVDHDPFA